VTAPTTPSGNAVLRVGLAWGGPLGGKELVSRYDEGILAIDMANRRCWIYDYDFQAMRFVVRENEGRMLVDVLRMSTAEEGRYDIVAVGS